MDSNRYTLPENEARAIAATLISDIEYFVGELNKPGELYPLMKKRQEESSTFILQILTSVEDKLRQKELAYWLKENCEYGLGKTVRWKTKEIIDSEPEVTPLNEANEHSFLSIKHRLKILSESIFAGSTLEFERNKDMHSRYFDRALELLGEPPIQVYERRLQQSAAEKSSSLTNDANVLSEFFERDSHHRNREKQLREAFVS